MDFGSLFLSLVLILNLSMIAAVLLARYRHRLCRGDIGCDWSYRAKAGVVINGDLASASADATARVGMPIFLMLFDIFPRLLSAHNVNPRCGIIR